MNGPLTHLAVLAGFGLTEIGACGRWSKHLTHSAGSVTCEDCKKTWDYALAQRREAERAEAGRKGCPRCAPSPWGYHPALSSPRPDPQQEKAEG